jgi:hypothetical protein
MPRRPTCAAVASLALACLSAGLFAQAPGADPAATRPDPQRPQGENLKTPPTWKVRLDKPDPGARIGAEKDADVFFVNMTPGWHVTTSRAAIFWHPASTASGDYRAAATLHSFDPKSRHQEGYGIFFGGSDLEGEGQAYGYFLLRNDGKFLIKKRQGAATALVQDWTAHAAIARWTPESGASVENRLAVEASGETVTFEINGEPAASHPRAALPTAGVVGLRLNHHVNVHVSDLAVTPRGE